MSPEYITLSDNNTDHDDIDDDTDTVVAETVITGEWFITGAGAVTGSCIFSRQWLLVFGLLQLPVDTDTVSLSDTYITVW